MKLLLDPHKTVHDNAAAYYEEAKKSRRKAEGARRAAGETRKKIRKKEQELAAAQETAHVANPATPSAKRKQKDKQKWFDEFHSFTTSGGFLVLAGKDAKQNDVLGSKHLAEGDLFFHADIVGAPATILKTQGGTPTEQDELEAAQWAAVYSRAWKQGSHTVDVYSVPGNQISKHSHGEYVGKGAFMVLGKRKYYRNTELKVKIGLNESGQAAALPANSTKPLRNAVVLSPGQTEKKAAAKTLAKKLGASEDGLMSSIPGNSTQV